MTILVIEGCDASGKSTLIKELSKRLPEFVVKKGSSFEHSQCTNQQLEQKFWELVNESDNTSEEFDENIIFDRFVYSNCVYASLYNDYAILSPHQRTLIENAIYPETAIIYLYASPEELTRRLNTRGDDYVKAERIPSILQKYNEVLLTVDKSIPIYSFDTEAMSTDSIVDYIIDNILEGE